MHIPSVLQSDRLHNRIVRKVVEDELKNHWQKRIPGHFRQDARHKYRYAERQSAYKAYKSRKFKSRRDLVKTGATERLMKSQYRITVGGSAEGGKSGGVNGRLWLWFAWDTLVAQHMRRKFARGLRRGASRAQIEASIKTRTGVNLAQMRKEIQAFTDQELSEIGKSMQQRYTDKVNNDTTPRQRKVVN